VPDVLRLAVVPALARDSPTVEPRWLVMRREARADIATSARLSAAVDNAGSNAQPSAAIRSQVRW